MLRVDQSRFLHVEGGTYEVKERWALPLPLLLARLARLGLVAVLGLGPGLPAAEGQPAWRAQL
jgi:hypothetical protein